MQIEPRKYTERWRKIFFLPADGQKNLDNFLSNEKATAYSTIRPEGMRTPIQNPRSVHSALSQHDSQCLTERVSSILHYYAKYFCAKTLLEHCCAGYPLWNPQCQQRQY